MKSGEIYSRCNSQSTTHTTEASGAVVFRPLSDTAAIAARSRGMFPLPREEGSCACRPSPSPCGPGPLRASFPHRGLRVLWTSHVEGLTLSGPLCLAFLT